MRINSKVGHHSKNGTQYHHHYHVGQLLGTYFRRNGGGGGQKSVCRETFVLRLYVCKIWYDNTDIRIGVIMKRANLIWRNNIMINLVVKIPNEFWTFFLFFFSGKTAKTTLLRHTNCTRPLSPAARVPKSSHSLNPTHVWRDDKKRLSTENHRSGFNIII